ncbi:MAG: hypothetical protein SFY92_09175 [Verrucomicrobiae bacterium]|nr:hypothetical protein [Verrucomicrobiae bacterium]
MNYKIIIAYICIFHCAISCTLGQNKNPDIIKPDIISSEGKEELRKLIKKSSSKNELAIFLFDQNNKIYRKIKISPVVVSEFSIKIYHADDSIEYVIKIIEISKDFVKMRIQQKDKIDNSYFKIQTSDYISFHVDKNDAAILGGGGNYSKRMVLGAYYKLLDKTE